MVRPAVTEAKEVVYAMLKHIFSQRIRDRVYPYLVAVAATMLWHSLDISFPQNPSNILSATLTLAAILTGFLATAKAILMGLRGTELLKALHQSGYIDDLITYLAEAFWFCFTLSIWVLVGFFVTMSDIYELLWILLSTLAATTYIRVSNIMLKALRHVAGES